MRRLGTVGPVIMGLIMLARVGEPPVVKGQERPTRYPAHWWTPHSREGAPAWEILPQEAGPGEVILSKRHELGLLSNFAATPFTFRGQRYASLEGFWQMMLYPEGTGDERARFPGLSWKHTRAQVSRMSSFEAKSAGDLAEANMKSMGIEWVTFEGKKFEYRTVERGEHYRLIVAATWEKVKQNPKVRGVLLATGDLKLRPDHYQEPNAPAAWRYFEILTAIRTELQRAAVDTPTDTRKNVAGIEQPPSLLMFMVAAVRVKSPFCPSALLGFIESSG
jgi:predicted NAD-dependent protein-ADP-ribosyltransferase YbiA (DUF1768 family)